jgi:hypothetical protein
VTSSPSLTCGAASRTASPRLQAILRRYGGLGEALTLRLLVVYGGLAVSRAWWVARALNVIRAAVQTRRPPPSGVPPTTVAPGRCRAEGLC